MNARVPQDVDLEDRLIYGLSPIRFAYLVVAVLGALSVWRTEVLPPWLRVLPCVLLLAAAVVLAWGRWRGRPVDRWLLDVAVFVRRNHRVGLRSRPRQPKGARPEVVVPLTSISAISAAERPSL